MLVLVKFVNKTKYWFPESTIESNKEITIYQSESGELINKEVLDEVTIDKEIENISINNELAKNDLSVNKMTDSNQ